MKQDGDLDKGPFRIHQLLNEIDWLFPKQIIHS